MSEEVKSLFFAKARELVCLDSASLTVPSACGYCEILEVLESTFAPLCQLKRRYLIAINEDYLDSDGTVIGFKTGDEMP